VANYVEIELIVGKKNDNLEMLITFDLPINPKYLSRIEKIIKDQDIIRTVYSEDEFDRYSFLEYMKQIYIHKTKIFALLDRNIFIDIISIASKAGQRQNNFSKTEKTTSALLAFLQLMDTLIEPNIAILEYIDSGHHKQAEKELALFRAADNVHPKYYVDIALGKSVIIPKKELAHFKETSISYLKGENISRWKLFYGSILKMAILERKGGDTLYKIEEYLKWMYSDYLFISPAIRFCVIYFSAKRFRKMIKSLGSGEKEKIKRGLRNATWDMYLVYYWSEKVYDQNKKNEIWILCTEDKAVKEIAKYIICTITDQKRLDEINKSQFINCLGIENGQKVHELYSTLVKKVDNKNRAINKSYRLIDSNIYDLERQLL
jgi:hypothetical protein